MPTSTRRNVPFIRKSPANSQHFHGAMWASPPTNIPEKRVCLFFLQQLSELAHEAVDVLELAVDLGKADVGDLVEGLEALHNKLADLRRGHLAVERVLDDLLNRVRCGLELRQSHRALLAGAEHAV